MGDLKHEQVVHICKDKSRSRKSVEFRAQFGNCINLLRIDILNCKSQLDIMDSSLGIVSPKFFYLETSCFISFSKSSHLVLFSFSLCMLFVMNV